MGAAVGESIHQSMTEIVGLPRDLRIAHDLEFR